MSHDRYSQSSNYARTNSSLRGTFMMSISNERSNSALKIALDNEDLDSIKTSIDAGADIHTKNSQKLTALHVAAKKYNYSMVKHLLSYWGVDIKGGHDQLSALHFVIQEAKEENCDEVLKVVELLLENKADVNAEDINGNTPLHFLFRNEKNSLANKIIVRVGTLLELYKADILLRNIKLETPLELARRVHANCSEENKDDSKSVLDRIEDSAKRNIKYDILEIKDDIKSLKTSVLEIKDDIKSIIISNDKKFAKLEEKMNKLLEQKTNSNC